MIFAKQAVNVGMRHRAFSIQSLLRSTALMRVCSAGALGLALSGALFASPALADCTPAAANGVTATCTGTTINQGGGAPGTSSGQYGYGTGVETGVTVNVVSGATNTVSGNDFGIYLGDATVTNTAGGIITGGGTGIIAINGSADVTNSGRITGGTGATNYGILAGTNATVTNTAGGTIAGGDIGIFALNGFADITNSGRITGTGANGIAALTNATVINTADGSITGGRIGIVAANGFANVTNSGSIVGSFDYGITAGTNATVTNTAGGTIAGGNTGIFAIFGSADVTNSGRITGTGATGIAAGTNATVINTASGIITGGQYGVLANGGGSSVFNAGTISGGTAAIRFAGAGNTLTLAQGSVITGNVLGTGSDTFQLGGTSAATFDVSALGPTAQYQGFDTFNKIGSSVWTLTGTSSFTGAINVNAGTLVVNGDLSSASLMFVNPGGTLSGTGIVPFTLLDLGATLAPGPLNGTGTLTIMDRVTFCDCATYAVKVSGANSDRVNVVAGGLGSGEADLIGLVRVSSPTGNYRFNSAYTILSAQGGLNGTTFDTLATPTGMSGALSYTSNDVLLTLTSQLGQTAGLNGNQQRLATTLDTAFNAPGGGSNGLGAIFGDHIAQNLTQASGEVGTAPQQTTFQAMTMFMGLISDPFSAGRGGVNGGANSATGFADEESMAYAGRAKSKNPRDAFAALHQGTAAAAFDQRWNVWTAGFGGSQTTDGNAVAGSGTATSSIYGAAVGADYRFSPDTVAGFALAGAGSNFSVAGGGSGRSDMFQAGAFVRQNFGATYLTAAAAYGWQDVTTDRTITVAGVDHLRANFNANAYSGRLELGHRFLTPWFGGLGVSPYAAAQITAFELPSYNERAVSGASTFALNYGADTTTSSRTELGLRSDKSFALDGAMLTLRGRAAWAHDFNPDRAVTATFQTLPGASFITNGAALASDSALTTASAEVRWLNGWSVAGTFEGEFSDVTRSYAGKGVVRYNW